MAKATFEGLVERVVRVWQRGEQSLTAAAIGAGELAHRAVRLRVLRADDPATRRKLRGEAIATIATALTQAGCPGQVNRMVRAYNVSLLFGPEAKQLSLRALCQFARLLRRNPSKEEWCIRSKYVDTGRDLWREVIAGSVPVVEVREKIDALVGRVPSANPRSRPASLKQAVMIVGQLSTDDQRKLVAMLLNRLEVEPEIVKPGLKRFLGGGRDAA